MREGSLEAPTRHPIPWQEPSFYDEAALDLELRRVFDICHGCRRCFNLCDSFPKLFDLVDTAPSEELDTVKSADFGPVVDACTLCDMCYMTKCPYVPPHSFNLDFPHLMLRYRAVEAAKGKITAADAELAKMDRNAKLASLAAPIANWASDTSNTLTRPLLSKFAGLHPDAALPKFEGQSLEVRAARTPLEINRDAPGFGRKAVIYATCHGNHNDTAVGMAARAVLALNGVDTQIVYPGCCGMPLLEQGEIAKVADSARHVAAELGIWIARGYDVIALVPSCALMLKSEWPLILPDDSSIKTLAKASYDITEYVVDIAKKEGLAPGLAPIGGSVAVHMACHARAQNMGQKAAEMLRLLPEADVQVIERCSGHGGSWGFKNEYFETAIKVGRPVARTARDSGKSFVTSECPLAGVHIMQGIDRLPGDAPKPERITHPIQLVARSYGI